MSPDLELEKVLRVLVERFGQSRTLGEVLATTYGLRAYREGRELTVADISANTGISKQNLSRWLRVHIETDHVVTEPHDNDGRMQALTVTQLEYACRHLPAVAEVFDCAVEAPVGQRINNAIRPDDA